MPDLTGQQFGRYRILNKLGAGGMGEVYLAHDTQMDRRVALKMPQLEGRETEAVLARFYREARVVAEIRHPAVCPVYDVGEVDGIHFLTMAYIEGEPLDKVIRRAGRKSVGEALDLVRRVAEAMYELHRRGIVHRDLKPANIMLQPSGVPVLVDFGLARALSSQSQAVGANSNVGGTPGYMAPEQATGQTTRIKPWTDVYSLGVILFELLTGRLPFEALNAVHYALQVVHGERPRPSQFEPQVPPTVDALCLAMLAVDPAQRPANMWEVAARAGQPIQASQPLVQTVTLPTLEVKKGTPIRAVQSERKNNTEESSGKVLRMINVANCSVVVLLIFLKLGLATKFEMQAFSCCGLPLVATYGVWLWMSLRHTSRVVALILLTASGGTVLSVLFALVSPSTGKDSVLRWEILVLFNAMSFVAYWVMDFIARPWDSPPPKGG